MQLPHQKNYGKFIIYHFEQLQIYIRQIKDLTSKVRLHEQQKRVFSPLDLMKHKQYAKEIFFIAFKFKNKTFFFLLPNYSLIFFIFLFYLMASYAIPLLGDPMS